MTSSPTSFAPALKAVVAMGESGGQMTHIRADVLTGCGNRRRLRTAGPFLSVLRLICISYLEEVGGRPTSKARI